MTQRAPHRTNPTLDAGRQLSVDPATSGRTKCDLGDTAAPSVHLATCPGELPSAARLTAATPATLYLDQNYLSGIAKRKPAFAELEPILRSAIAQGTITVLESKVHRRESAPRPDLKLLELLRELSHGHKLPDTEDHASREVRRRLQRTIAYELPERRARPGDSADLDALAQALTHCDLVTCDAFMADVVKRARLDLHHRAELFSGRHADVIRLRNRLQTLTSGP